METLLIKTAGRTVRRSPVCGVGVSGDSGIEGLVDTAEARAKRKHPKNAPGDVAGDRASLSRRLLNSLVCQTVVAGFVFGIVLMLFYRAVGVDLGALQLAILAATIAAAFGCLRLLLGVGIPTATAGGLLYLCHPLCATHTLGSPESLTLAPLLLVPLALLSVGFACRTPGVLSSIGLGVMLGASFAVEPSAGIILAAVTGLYAAFEVVQTPWKRTIGGGRWRAAFLVMVVVIVSMFVATAMPRIVGRVGPTLPIASSTVPPAEVTAPFALVDRDGLLATRLGALPNDLTAGGGTHYLGWSLLALCLIAVWPARRDEGDENLARTTRCAAVLLILAFGLMWLMRGSESLHAQLVGMFEFATVKRYVEPAALHLLGLMTVPLLLVCAVLFLSVGTLLSSRAAGALLPGRKRWTWAAVFMAATAVISWWPLTPTPLLPTSFLSSTVAGGSTITAPLVAVLLICGAVAGIQRLMAGTNHKLTRLALWLITLAILTADVAPYVRTAPEEHRTQGEQKVEVARQARAI